MTRKRCLLLFAAQTCTFIVLRVVDSVVATRAAGSVINLQIAGNERRVSQIVTEWRTADHLPIVGFALGVDYLHRPATVIRSVATP